MVFVIHWQEPAMVLHVFPILIPPPTSLSTWSLWVFPVHQVRALVSCIQPGLVICFTLDNIHVSRITFFLRGQELKSLEHITTQLNFNQLPGKGRSYTGQAIHMMSVTPEHSYTCGRNYFLWPNQEGFLKGASQVAQTVKKLPAMQET